MNTRPALPTALGLAFAFAPAEGFTQITERTDFEVVEEEGEGRHVTFVGKLVGGMNQSHEHTIGLVGPGFDVEVELWHHGLELELASAALFGPDMTCMPTELLLKKAIHITGDVDVFAGVGGIVNFVHSAEGGWASHPGGVGLVGTTFWSHDGHMGVLVEVAYAMLSEHEHLAHEVEAGLGVAFRL